MVTATVEAPAEPQPKRTPTRRTLLLDGGLAVGLFIVALLYRRHFPPDGLFYDDAWEAFGAAEGSLRQLITIGQTQPGLGLELMAWSRIFGHSATTMIVPTMIAGALGPPVLYLVLRKFGYAVSIAFLLGAALTVCETAITYSGRVKSYTTDVLVILMLCLLLPWLAKRRWTVLIAAAWFVGSVAVASYSSFALLATVAAAAVLLLHPHEDRKLRLVSVGAQGVALLGIFKAEDATHDAEQLADFFKPSKAYIEFHLNPVTFGREIIEHLVRVTDIFPGGPGWVSVLCMIAATVGLLVMARRGSKAVVGRFLVLLVLLAIVGAVAERVP
ncbi:MAG TPA: glycosyltransferase family 39 protein, partial [Acidimicrobiales bacterium]|nr:glycosyltransferase family 39 protein [Acidimicrobiales bacterium]